MGVGILPETRAAEGGGDAVVVAGEHVVEPRVGAEPVDAGGAEEPLRGGRRLGPPAPSAGGGEVAAGAQVEQVPRRRGPAVGATVQVHLPQRAGGHGLLPPIARRRLVLIPALGRGRWHRRRLGLGAGGRVGGLVSLRELRERVGLGYLAVEREAVPIKQWGCGKGKGTRCLCF